ncbi:MAG TPA: alpha/beta fold hydrolase [Vicinamibacteria bacterium]|nr:alpha/beta fold hydrolase [Vicinamibacteria bacterium]
MRRALFVIGVVTAALIGLVLRGEAPPGPTGAWLQNSGLTPRYETVEGLRVRYVRAGRGPAVVLLHGFASSIYTWKDVLPTLSEGHDVVALDLPGFGGSDLPADLSFELYPRVVRALLDRLGIARADLVGNSMGGALAVVLAATDPSRVGRLVLIDAAGFNLAARDRPFLIRVAGFRPMAALIDHLPVRRLLVGAALRQVFHDRALVTPERLEEYAAPMLRPGAPAATRSLLATLRLHPGAVAELAPRVQAPTLILWGRYDAWIPPPDADRFARAISGSRVVLLEDCGHLPQEERPAEVARLLVEFLGRSPPLAPGE